MKLLNKFTIELDQKEVEFITKALTGYTLKIDDVCTDDIKCNCPESNGNYEEYIKEHLDRYEQGWGLQYSFSKLNTPFGGIKQSKNDFTKKVEEKIKEAKTKFNIH